MKAEYKKLNLTPTGLPKDRCYYLIECPKHGKVLGVCAGKKVICLQGLDHNDPNFNMNCKEKVKIIGAK